MRILSQKKIFHNEERMDYKCRNCIAICHNIDSNFHLKFLLINVHFDVWKRTQTNNFKIALWQRLLYLRPYSISKGWVHLLGICCCLPGETTIVSRKGSGQLIAVSMARTWDGQEIYLLKEKAIKWEKKNNLMFKFGDENPWIIPKVFARIHASTGYDPGTWIKWRVEHVQSTGKNGLYGIRRQMYDVVLLLSGKNMDKYWPVR